MNNKELWKIIPDTSYMVSTHGRVKHIKRTKPLKPKICDQGYHLVNIHGKNKRVHRLVAQVFLPNNENKKQVNHIDGNKSNNSISNLEWINQSENIKHAYAIGIHNKKRRRMTKSFITKIYDEYKTSSIRTLCKKYKLSHSVVKNSIDKKEKELYNNEQYILNI